MTATWQLHDCYLAVTWRSFLDQSWWPDGQYTAPTDEGLAYDVKAVPMFGLNMIRLHQKVNPERWYYHADKSGVVGECSLPSVLACDVPQPSRPFV